LPERLLRGIATLQTAAFNRLPAGAWPFRYASFKFKHGDRIVMEAKPYYFRGRPKLDRFEYRFLPDENTQTTQMLTGEIDLAIRLEPTQLLRLTNAHGLSFVKTPSVSTGYAIAMRASASCSNARTRATTMPFAAKPISKRAASSPPTRPQFRRSTAKTSMPHGPASPAFVRTA
jgi:ABC-type transport system substrate-binding protein